MNRVEFMTKKIDEFTSKFFDKDVTYWHVKPDIKTDDLLKFITLTMAEIFDKIEED